MTSSRAVQCLRASFRIASDVAIYRLRKREAANLFTSITLAFALRESFGSLSLRLLFGALLNLFVYLVNDCFDITLDLQAQGRDGSRTRFLSEHRAEAWWTVALLAALLLGLGAGFGHGLFVAALVNIAVIFGYSAWLKHRPIADLFAMGLWGLSMAMVGFPVSSSAGWRFAGLLGLLCMVTEAVQVLRDEPTDRAAGVRTTAVVLGAGTTALIARALIATASSYTTLCLDARVGPLLALGVLVPLSSRRATRSWDILRVIFGLCWLALLTAYRYAP